MAAGDDAQRTLFHPFETGDLDPPGQGQRVLFLGAEPGFRLPDGFAADLTLVQGFKPDVTRLKAARHRVVVEPEGEDYDLALVQTGKHRGLNEMRLSEAIRLTRPGGLILVGGSKEDGIASMRARLEGGASPSGNLLSGNRAPIVETRDGAVVSQPRAYHPWNGIVLVEGSLSKYHGVAFWLRKSADADEYADTIHDWQSNWPLIAGRFRTAPGMFSHDRIDAGSRLLAENIPANLTGAVADFCAGWGYLAVETLDRCAGVTSLELFEADHASLEAAKTNLADARVPVAFHWTDLATEAVPRSFDAIVMNPPFHAGKAADPGIGHAMIRAASAALKPNGRLYMVANRGLPYEAALSASFRQIGEIVRDQTYKVLWARR